MQSIIEVRDVRRSFKSVVKEEGLKGAFGLLVKPEYKVHDALKGVSFSIEPGFPGSRSANLPLEYR